MVHSGEIIKLMKGKLIYTIYNHVKGNLAAVGYHIVFSLWWRETLLTINLHYPLAKTFSGKELEFTCSRKGLQLLRSKQMIAYDKWLEGLMGGRARYSWKAHRKKWINFGNVSVLAGSCWAMSCDEDFFRFWHENNFSKLTSAQMLPFWHKHNATTVLFYCEVHARLHIDIILPVATEL